MTDHRALAWPPAPIKTERLVLRAAAARDRAVVIELNASPEVNTYLGGGQPRAELERTLPEVPGQRPGFFVVELDGAAIGTIQLDPQRAETPSHRLEAGETALGYLFLPESWGRGYASEACAAALDWFSGQLPDEPVVLYTQSANAASMRLAAKLGFTERERFEAWGAEQWFGVRPPARKQSWRLPDRVRVSGGEVAVGSYGDGPPVVLTHGTPAWSFLWREVVPLLAQRHTVYVWDLLGYGDSRLADGEHPSIALQARTLAELVAHWGLERPALVGHDIGGGVVTRAHLVEEVPVSALALVDAAVLGPWNTPFTEHMQQYAEAYRTMPQEAFADLVEPRMRTAVHRPMPDEVHAAYMRPWVGVEGQRRWVDQVAAVSFRDTEEAVARLGSVSAPALVLWGAEDRWLVPSTADRLAAAIPGARRELIAGGGHFLPEDAPAEVAGALLGFLGEKPLV